MSSQSSILVIDDEESMRDSCTKILAKEGYRVAAASDGQSALLKAREVHPHVALVDLKMPGMSGMEVIDKIRDIDPSIVSVVITGYATIESAVEAMKRGAYDYLAKPFTPDELRIVVARGLEKRELWLEAESLREEKRRVQENFITLVSHELRSPLVDVQQYCHTLAKGFVGELAEQQMRMMERAMERIKGMLELVDDWLSLARVEAGKLVKELKPTSVASVLHEVINAVASAAEAKHIPIELECASGISLVQGDKETLKLAFTNLITNAINYNVDGGEVHVRVREHESSVMVEVSDTGIGIPRESLPFIFDQFYRADRNEEKRVGGSGLGLSIVRRILDAHSGSISAASEPGKGSTFTVALPKAKENDRGDSV